MGGVVASFLSRPSQEVAPSLLGCVLWSGEVAVRLTEVEAYGGANDPASHAYRGQTARNAVMFGPPGHAYVYFTYGMHFCVNLVCMPAGVASAVLLRAGEIVAGVSTAQSRRGASVPFRDLARGPARLCQALGIDRSLDGAPVCDPAGPLRLEPPAGGAAPIGGVTVGGAAPVGGAVPVDGAVPVGGAAPVSGAAGSALARRVLSGPRVGVREGADTPWRFWLEGEPTVSVYRPHVPLVRTRPT
jgi:DNA-3-methyladenine glycosylase